MSSKFGNLRRDNIISIFNTSLDKVSTTRTELSELTGLSFVTTGKVCDKLIELDILRQSMTTHKTASRRSRILTVKFKYWIGVYVLEPERFTFNICDLTLRCKYSYVYRHRNDIFIDESMNTFLKKAREFTLKHINPDRCCGIAVLTDGEYDEVRDRVNTSKIPHFSALRIKKLISEYSHGNTPVVHSLYSAYAKDVCRSITDDVRMLSIIMNKGHIQCALFCKDQQNYIKYCDLGRIKINTRKTINDICRETPKPDALFLKFSDIVNTLIYTYGVNSISIYGNLYNHMDAARAVLYEEVSKMCQADMLIPPEISLVDIRIGAIKYISGEIRNTWFTEKILKED